MIEFNLAHTLRTAQLLKCLTLNPSIAIFSYSMDFCKVPDVALKAISTQYAAGRNRNNIPNGYGNMYLLPIYLKLDRIIVCRYTNATFVQYPHDIIFY